MTASYAYAEYPKWIFKNFNVLGWIIAKRDFTD